MPIISVEIMKTIDEREIQKTKKRKTNKDRKEQGEQKLQWKGESQRIKASLIFKSNLELALSITLK